MAPQEICERHDLRIDEYGCWACGHAGPISDDLFSSWVRWCQETERIGVMASWH